MQLHSHEHGGGLCRTMHSQPCGVADARWTAIFLYMAAYRCETTIACCLRNHPALLPWSTLHNTTKSRLHTRCCAQSYSSKHRGHMHLMFCAGAPPGLSPYWCRKWARVTCDQSNQVSGLDFDGLAINGAFAGVLEVMQQLPALQVSLCCSMHAAWQSMAHLWVCTYGLRSPSATGAGAGRLAEKTKNLPWQRLWLLRTDHCSRSKCLFVCAVE